MVNESIVKVAIMARRAGMSYGAYVAQNPHGLPRDEAGLHTRVNIPGEQRFCYVCGTALPRGNRNYCSPECREIGQVAAYYAVGIVGRAWKCETNGNGRLWQKLFHSLETVHH